MKFKEKIQSVFEKLGLTSKAKEKKLTTEDWKNVAESYQTQYKSSLRDDMAAAQKDEENGEDGTPKNSLSQEQMDALQAMLKTEEADDGTQPSASTTGEPATFDSIVASINGLTTNVSELQKAMAPDTPTASVSVPTTLSLNGPGTTVTHLFGIENPIFSMDQRWNRLSINPSLAGEQITKNDKKAFSESVENYSASLQARYNYLHQNHMLQADKLAAGDFATNLDGVKDAKVGDQYVVLRQDALIARILKIRDLTTLFPVRYGIQDHDLIFNAFFDSVSQAYQTGEIFKGGMKIEHEMGHVDDAMIKLKFGPMKEIERMYIGYLNKEGSDPIKWSMIEFCIFNSLKTAQVEQNKRRVRGIYVKPETGVAGHYLNSSTGIIHTLIRYVHENKILLNSEDTYRTYTSSNMLDAVKEFVNDVISSCTEDMDLDNKCIYLNKMHKSWWLENVRAEYGKDTDFQGPNSYANVVPDTNLRIVWMPYLGQLPLMFIQEPGNLQFLENIPGEMLTMQLEALMELIRGWSVWKEGCSAAFVGRHFDSKDELKANNFAFQEIFMNKPCKELATDAIEITAGNFFWFLTKANTQATAITDVKDAKQGTAYIIECGATEHASTIAKSDKFSTLTEPWTPTKEGDYIMVVLNSKGKFQELERQVGGARTINKELQPHVPGVR